MRARSRVRGSDKKRAPCGARRKAIRRASLEAVFQVRGIDLGVDVESVILDLVVVEVHAEAPVAVEIDAGTDARVTIHAVRAVGVAQDSAGGVGEVGPQIDDPLEKSGAGGDVPLVGGIEMPIDA